MLYILGSLSVFALLLALAYLPDVMIKYSVGVCSLFVVFCLLFRDRKDEA